MLFGLMHDVSTIASFFGTTNNSETVGVQQDYVPNYSA
jgi:hypothetical protein